MNQGNLKECERCRKTLIHEEFPTHVCVPDITGIREIMIDYSYETVTKDGDRKIVAFGLDGRIYDLIICKHNPVHKSKNPNITFGPAPDDFGHAQDRRSTRHRLDRTPQEGS